MLASISAMEARVTVAAGGVVCTSAPEVVTRGKEAPAVLVVDVEGGTDVAAAVVLAADVSMIDEVADTKLVRFLALLRRL
jgi:hypothetical protein